MLTGKSILVVDDEPDLREILMDEFSLEGATVKSAANGKEALQICQAERFHAVVSDIRMPGGDGVSLAKALKSRSPTDPVVVLVTGFADLTAQEAFEIGVEGFVSKPFQLEAVRDQILRLLMPSQERWTVPSPEHSKVLSVEGSPYLSRDPSSYIGRGGIFWPAETTGFRVGEVVLFRAGADFFGTGVIRWIRSSVEEGRSPGFGIEVLSLPEPSGSWLMNQIEKLNPTSYLPRGF